MSYKSIFIDTKTYIRIKRKRQNISYNNTDIDDQQNTNSQQYAMLNEHVRDQKDSIFKFTSRSATVGLKKSQTQQQDENPRLHAQAHGTLDYVHKIQKV